MRRRLTIILAVLLALTAVTAVLWEALDWPPPRLLLKYGLPPAGGPTGTTKLIGGVEFAEVAPGYCWVERRVWKDRGDLLGRICAAMGLPWGNPPRPGKGHIVEWIEVPDYIWLSTQVMRPPSNEQLEALASARSWTLSTHWQEQGHIGDVRPATSRELHFACESGALRVEAFDFVTAHAGEDVLAAPDWGGRDWSEGEVTQRKYERFMATLLRLRERYVRGGGQRAAEKDEAHEPLQLCAIHVWIPPAEPD